MDYVSGPVPLRDDAVTTDSIFVTNADLIQNLNVGLRVDHPRISDLVFHLLAPDGSRYLLMENRGGLDTNGCGATILITNTYPVSHNGDANAYTNSIDTGTNSGVVTINYDLLVLPDTIDVYYDGVDIWHFDPPYTGSDISGTTNINYGPGSSTEVSIVINQGGNTNYPGTAWEYTALTTSAKYLYLDFTEDTNLTTTPIKFAPTPFVPSTVATTNTLDDFESASSGDYLADNGDSVDIWSVDNNQVSVVNDPATAQGGNQFLALANGTISTSLKTIPGNQYTVSFYYRGPGIAGWWRAENNSANDSINGNNGTLMNGTGFAGGEVGTAFNLNGANNYVVAKPASPSNLDVGAGSGFTLEGWINPTGFSVNKILFEYERALGTADSADIGILMLIQSASLSGSLYINIIDNTPTHDSHQLATSANQVVTGVWQHVAATYDKASGLADLYINGVMMAQANLGSLTPQTSFTNLLLGARTTYFSTASPGNVFSGKMDEMSVYGRALSASEILAISSATNAGKYDPAVYLTNAASSLAEATVTIPGISTNTIVGDNTNWQVATITFTATDPQTSLSIAGVEPGMLLDTFTLVSAPGNLYYLPEQSISGVQDQSPYGWWTMEVQDDRVGATNGTLVKWQLHFTLANTNLGEPFFGVLAGGGGATNTEWLAAGQLGYYEVDVPTNANFATNILLFADQPVNVWFSPNFPPTITNGNDVVLIPDSTNGLQMISTTTTPQLMPGTTYYLVVQNTNSLPVTFALKVNFDVPGQFSNLHFSRVVMSANGLQLQWPVAAGMQYQVQWANSLASPMNWNTVTNPNVTIDNGTATFTDDGSETAPPGQMRFYRLVQISP